MIITRIFQGLGNQFFQYAFGRAMALRNNTELKLDTSFFEDSEVTQFGYTYKRNFELARYNVDLSEATELEVARYKDKVSPSYWNRLVFRARPELRPKIIREDLSIFDRELCNMRGNLYLDGYFTSELFFKEHADVIRGEFQLRNQMSSENKVWADRMKRCNSVCISYRRTNFVNNPLHEVCFMEYYMDGLKKAQELIGGDIEVFIWSDDNEWTKANFKPPYKCHYITHNFPDFHEDLRLMTFCKHHVIPNSTFSWWAAWLGEWEGQVVIAPERWLNSEDIAYHHVIPTRWHRIKN